MSDSKSLEIERLQRKIAVLKESFESKLKQKEERIRTLEEKITQDKRLIVDLTAALGVIAHRKQAMVLEAFKFVTDIDEPLAKAIVRNVNAAAARMAKYAREVNRSRPERQTGGEKIGRQPENTTANIEVENTAAGNEAEKTIANNKVENNIANGEVENNIAGIEVENNTAGNEVEKTAATEEVQPKPPRASVALTKLTRQVEELEIEYNLASESSAVLKQNRPPADCTEPPETHRGRRLNAGELERFDLKVLEPVVECPKCHTPLNAVDPKTKERLIADLGELVDIIKTVETGLSSKRGGAVKLGYHAYRCGVCGNIFNDRPEGGDCPMVPGRSISTHSFAEILYGQTLGFTINAAGRDYERDAKMGGNTISLGVHDIDRFVLTPVAKLLAKRQMAQEAICADETPFSVKQAQHAGRRPAMDNSPPELFGATHVVVAASARRSLEQIILFMLCYGRSSEKINNLFLGHRFKALNCDDYAGYDEVMRNHPDAVRQLCLVHWRRTLMNNAFDLKVLRDYFDLPESKQKAYLLDQIRNEKPLYQIVQVGRAISYVYGHERAIDKLGPAYDPNSTQLKEIRKKQTALMDLVGSLVRKLAVGHAEAKKTETGEKWRCVAKGDPMGLACAQFLNNETELRTFLRPGNILIEPDNNVAERSIRPIAVIRANSHFWHSREYAEATLARFTVVKTLEANHIEPLKWIKDLCGDVYDFVGKKLIDYNWMDFGASTAKVGIRSEAKPGKEDKLKPEFRKYRLSEVLKEFPFADYVNSILGAKSKCGPSTAGAQKQSANS